MLLIGHNSLKIMNRYEYDLSLINTVMSNANGHDAIHGCLNCFKRFLNRETGKMENLQPNLAFQSLHYNAYILHDTLSQNNAKVECFQKSVAVVGIEPSPLIFDDTLLIVGSNTYLFTECIHHFRTQSK